MPSLAILVSAGMVKGASIMDLVQNLQAQVTGTVIAPGDPEYEQVRLGWNLSIDQRPALILSPANAEDVAAGVRYARDAGLGVAVQSTGHGLKFAADRALLIVTSKMTSVRIDP